MSGRNEPIAVDVAEAPGGLIALCWAAREAMLRHSPLRLVYAQTDWMVSPLTGEMSGGVGCLIPPASAEPAVEFAVRLVAALEPTVDVSTYVRPTVPVQLLLDQSHRTPLVVVANDGAGALDNVLGGTICGALATHAACPVIAVNGRPAWPDAPIVVGITEPEAAALQAIEFGFEMADRRAAPLILQQVGDDVRQNRQVCATIARLARGRVSCTRRYPDVTISWQASHGDPVTTLTDAAADAQLLVMGAPTHGPMVGLITGSVTHRLLRRPPCPMAIVPANWRPSSPLADDGA